MEWHNKSKVKDDSTAYGMHLGGFCWNKADQLGGCFHHEMAASKEEEAVYRGIWEEISQDFVTEWNCRG